MTTAYTSLLGFALPATGDLSGTWGATINDNLTAYLDEAIAGAQIISGTLTAVTLSKTTGANLSQAGTGSTGSSQYQIIRCTGAPASLLTITAPAANKTYIVINATSTSQSVKIVGAGPTTGVTIASGKKTLVAWNGSDFVEVAPSSSGTVTSVAMTVPSFLSVTGSPITGSGTLALDFTSTTPLAIGYRALGLNTTGSQNTAVGANALYNNTTAGYNTAVGHNALTNNSSGEHNVAVGRNALSAVFNSGSFNVALGSSSLLGNTSGTNNTAVGGYSLSGGSSGSYNTGIGYLASCGSTGSGNISIGPVNSAGTNAPAFSISTESNRISMGSTGITNAYVQVAWTVVSDARDKTNFAPVPHGLDFVNQLNPTSYQFKVSREDDTPTGAVRYGFKAQDILALEGDNPVIIDSEDLEKLRFNSDSLIPVLVNAIKELTARLETLENKVA
jgi:hypothetical protein